MLRTFVTAHSSPPSSNSYLNHFASSRRSPSKNQNLPIMASSARIAVVGDVHDYWNLKDDSKALQLLELPPSRNPRKKSKGEGEARNQTPHHWCVEHNSYHSINFPGARGDFGEENVELVRSVAELQMPKAVILGNHDCWWTSKFSEKDKDRVQLQLECLGEEHVGYCRLDFPELKLSVVGGRPFSCGGRNLFRDKLLVSRYGVHDMEESGKKIYEAALGTPEGHSIVILAHNGPTGLGSKVDDICGKDWVGSGGDHGDPDLAQAISDLKGTTQLHIPLVVFGHMHKELAYKKGLRKMIVTGDDNILYLNGAIVPRIKYSTAESNINSQKDSSSSSPESEGTVRAFTLVDVLNGELEKIVETWVSVVGGEAKIEEETVLYKKQ
ncbi:hypothetical protein Scep_008584 [Stephania cephalantha]|uniref:Calcineurin-like phosphoesterase domain-containing protein n=1 Tax=Stephania cephalantha TaxID=152367 RepID=A0AAP0PMV3_9MAGN